MSGSAEWLYLALFDARVRVRRVMAVRLKRRTWRTWMMLQQAEAWQYNVEQKIDQRRASVAAKAKSEEA